MGLALAFESSCDETGVALVRDGREVIAAPLYSQIAEHRPYGGIIPEYASRSHLEKFTLLTAEIIRQHNLRPGQLDYVAVTVKPGLVGALLVGYETARAAARFFQTPLIGVHHLEAHLAAIRLTGHEIVYPSLGLLLSGGNSALYLMHAPGKISVLASTRDDAAGEALDKGAQVLGLGYPGGPLIEKMAREFNGHTEKNIFPVIMRDRPKDQIEFSFSGIKTALVKYHDKHPQANKAQTAFFYQERIVEHIMSNVERAVAAHRNMPLIAAGGVLANSRLRSALDVFSQQHKVKALIPALQFCTDNAAMVAAAAELYFEKNIESPFHNVTSDGAFS